MKEIFRDPVLFFLALSIIVSCTSIGSSVASALIYVITVILIMIKDGFKALSKRSLLLLLLFYIVTIFYSVFDKGTININSYKTQLFFFISITSVFIMSYHLKMLKVSQIRSLMMVAIISILYTVIGTTYVSFINPMAVRIYGFGEVESVDLDIASRYYSMGMMSYSLAHAMSLIAVVLSIVVCFTRLKYVKIFSVVTLLLIIRLLFVMTITTALMLAVIGVTVVFASYFSRGKVVLTTLIVIGVFVVFFVTGLASVFLDFSGGTNLEITEKLDDTYSYFETGYEEGQTGYRFKLYMASINTFLSNPLFGWGSDDGSRKIIGEHSYLFDYLAYYGVFALLLFVSWWKEYKYLKSFLSKTLMKYYYYAFIPVAGLVTLKAGSVCVVLPFMSLIIIQLIFLYHENDLKMKLSNKNKISNYFLFENKE